MKSINLAAAAVVLSASVLPLAAQAEGLSFNLGVFSSYGDDDPKSFRPAIQGGVDYDFGNGFYVGNWNSTGKFGGDLKGKLEVDLYAGFAQELSNGLSYDVNVTRYLYPGAGSPASNELNLTLGYGPVSGTYSKNFNTDGFTGAHTLGLTYSHAFNDKLSADFTVERTYEAGAENEYELAFSYDLGDDLTASATVSNTVPKFVLGISKSF